MPRFEIDEEELLTDTDTEYLEEENIYLTDTDKASALIAEVIGRNVKGAAEKEQNIRAYINEIFDIFSEDNLYSEVAYYNAFMSLCDSFSERQKINRLFEKRIIGVGGKFSSGKSKFINGITGIGSLLPEDTSPTTAIPTYIIKADENFYQCNEMTGNKTSLSEEQLGALNHGFSRKYNIGFSSFIESVIIGSSLFCVDETISLLDTPGYNKFDKKTKNTFSDSEKAKDQLKVADYLIWLADIDNGVITSEDLEFISDLDVKTPVLIVLNKCDKKTLEDISGILDVCVETVQDSLINCYGIVAYSSFDTREYDGRPMYQEDVEYSGHLFDDYLSFVRDSDRSKTDILSQFDSLRNNFKKDVAKYYSEMYKNLSRIEKEINNAKDVKSINSLTSAWSHLMRNYSKIDEKTNAANDLLIKVRKEIKKYVKEDTE